MSTTPAAPATGLSNAPARLFSMDVIRGVAILGILMISVWEFGGFTQNEQNLYRTGTHGGNYTLMNMVSIFFQGKMRALFALLFGAGILLYMQKQQRPSTLSAADAHIRRMIWLMVFGVVNAFILCWPGDILFHYGVLGILIFAFTQLKGKGFFIAAILCTLIYCGKQYWNYADDKKDYKKYLAVTVIEKKFKADSTSRATRDSLIKAKADTVLPKGALEANKLADSLAKKNDTLTTQQAQDKGKWEGLVKSLKYDKEATANNNKMMRAGWNKVAKHLMPQSQERESFWLYRIGIWDIGSLMFLGMALFSIGFFNNRFSKSTYLLIGVVAIVIGVALAWFRIEFLQLKTNDYEKYITKQVLPYNLFFPLERIILATGYASLLVWLVSVMYKPFRWIWEGLAAAGKMALSNYILQTIACTFFFYGYGFGNYGRLQQWQLYLFVVEMALAQVVFSVCWLRYYQLGPVEWLWRCLVYRQWLPNKKVTDTISNEHSGI